MQAPPASGRIASYVKFWPYYLSQHSRSATRAWHLAGTSLVLVLVAAAMVTADWRWLIGLPFAGYVPAWLSHYFIEHNQPATFQYPFWSLISDLRMLGLWLRGGLAEEVARRLRTGDTSR